MVSTSSTTEGSGVPVTEGIGRQVDYWLTVYRRTWRGTAISSFVAPLFYVVAMGMLLGGFIEVDPSELEGATSYLAFLVPGLAAAHRWMVRHFEGSEGLGAIFPAMVYSVFALRALGYGDDHEFVRRAMQQLEDLMIEEDGAVRVQPCVSPTWDTAIATIALADEVIYLADGRVADRGTHA